MEPILLGLAALLSAGKFLAGTEFAYWPPVPLDEVRIRSVIKRLTARQLRRRAHLLVQASEATSVSMGLIEAEPLTVMVRQH